MAAVTREALRNNDTSWVQRDPVRLNNQVAAAVGASLVAHAQVYTCHTDGAVRLWNLDGVMELEVQTKAAFQWRSIGWLNREWRHVVCCGVDAETNRVVLAVIDLANESWKRLQPASGSETSEVTMENVFGSGANYVLQEQLSPRIQYHIWEVDRSDVATVTSVPVNEIPRSAFEALRRQRDRAAFSAHNRFLPDLGFWLSIEDTRVRVTQQGKRIKTIRPAQASAYAGATIRMVDYDGELAVIAVDTSKQGGSPCSDLVVLDQRNLVLASADGFGNVTALHLKGNVVFIGETVDGANGVAQRHYLRVYGTTTRVTYKTWELPTEVSSIVEEEGKLVVTTRNDVLLIDMEGVPEGGCSCVLL